MPKQVGLILLVILLNACTFHPLGEKEEREKAGLAGSAFVKEIGERPLPILSLDPTPDELVSYALLSNAELESKYWEWRAAIEKIPQEGTQPTDLAIFFGASLNKGNFSRDRASVTLGNDPMGDIVLPQKLSAKARIALEEAKIVGIEFDKTKYALRSKVLNAYNDLALNSVVISLEQKTLTFIERAESIAETKSLTTLGGEEEVLKLRNDIDIAKNTISSLKAETPSLKAKLNSLLGRDSQIQINSPISIPAQKSLALTDAQILELAGKDNPEILALSHEIAASNESLNLSKLKSLPDFSISAGSDLVGVTQNLMGMFTVPILRYEAINAGIEEANNKLKSVNAKERQSKLDVQTAILVDLAMLHDIDRQLELFQGALLPRVSRIVSLSHKSYEVGKIPLKDLLESEQSQIGLQKLVATLSLSRWQYLLDIEERLGRNLGQS